MYPCPTISDYYSNKKYCDLVNPANPAKSVSYGIYRSFGSKRMEQKTMALSEKILSTASPEVQELHRKRHEEIKY